MQQHGGNVNAFAKEIGVQKSEVIDLSSNINFVKPKIDFDFNNLDITSYPNYEKLESAIANLYDINPTELELFNGATVAIYALIKLLQPKHATLYAPLYLEYEKALTLNNCKIKHMNRLENIYEEVEENSLVIFVNPSTPDGKYYELKKLMQMWIEKNCTILIDESFLDFTPYASCSPYLNSYEKLYLLKSMTKFYASAGIRIGALISNEKNMQSIKKEEPLWKISEFDSHYLQEALKDENFKHNSEQQNAQAHKILLNILQNFSYTKKLYASDTNFILIELEGIDAFSLQQKLMPFKIMIRNCENFHFLTKNHVRIAVKNLKSMNALTIALKTIPNV